MLHNTGYFSLTDSVPLSAVGRFKGSLEQLAIIMEDLNKDQDALGPHATWYIEKYIEKSDEKEMKVEKISLVEKYGIFLNPQLSVDAAVIGRLQRKFHPHLIQGEGDRYQLVGDCLPVLFREAREKQIAAEKKAASPKINCRIL